MEAKVCVCLHDDQTAATTAVAAGPALRASGNAVTFTCPATLREAAFPVNEATFNVEQVLSNPTANSLARGPCNGLATRFVRSRENAVVFAYGVRATPRRQLMAGDAHTPGLGGYAGEMMAEAVTAGGGAGGGGIFCVACYILGHTEHIVDLVKADNELGVLVESVKEGPRVRMVERARVTSAAEVRTVMASIARNYATYFANASSSSSSSSSSTASSSRQQQDAAAVTAAATPQGTALPPYNGDTMLLHLFRYDNEQAMAQYDEANSLNFVALADAERPVLCGVDARQQALYEKTHRVLLSAAGIVASIKCNRLRIPFGKSKLSQLLRRCYNAEKGNAHNTLNGPTNTVMLIHCVTDAAWAEESYHCLSMTRRISNTLKLSGIGSMLRDLAVEKWRLDQDIVELRDELTIAKLVYDYKPVICEAPKNVVVNIREEELKRIAAIQAKRDEARERHLAAVRQRAKEEAARLIKEQEASSGTTLAELEKTLQAKKRENAALQADREQRTREYEQALEKIRKKKDDEEAATAVLRVEMTQLEGELAIRQAAILAKQRQLEMARLDTAKGREAMERERATVQAARATVAEDRRRQREQWVRQIHDVSERALEQLRALAEERKQQQQHYGGAPTTTTASTMPDAASPTAAGAKEDAAERAAAADIRALDAYVQKLIVLEDAPANAEETESLRRQFDEMFAQEKQAYLSRIDAEKARKEKLEKGLEAYRACMLAAAQARKQAAIEDAARKEQHLSSLNDLVMDYLHKGVRMTKLSSRGHVRRRFYFLSDDNKRIHSCELDNQGNPLNRRKPPVTVWLKDIKRVVLGIYTSSFVNFSGEAQLAKTRQEAVTDNGTFRPEPTLAITPANLGLNNYRAFALLMRGGKSLELVCDSDSDYEAWAMTLKRLLGIETRVERLLRQRRQQQSQPPQSTGVDLVAPATTTTATTAAAAAAVPSMTSEQQVQSTEQAQHTCDMQYGGTLDIHNMRGFVSLTADEAQLCSERHIPPALFLRVKQEMMERAQSDAVNMYDVRICSGLDCIRASYLYDYLVEKRHVPVPL